VAAAFAAEGIIQALDHPAAVLSLLSGLLFTAGTAVLAAHAFGSGEDAAERAGAATVAAAAACAGAAALLSLAAEAERTLLVAQLARRASSSQAPGEPLLAAVQRVTAQAAAEAQLEPAQRSVPPLHALCAAASRGVGAAALSGFASGFMLCLAAALLVAGLSSAAKVSFLVAFSLHALCVACVLWVGPARVAAHRRGGRTHLQHDVGRALAAQRQPEGVGEPVGMGCS
jgi:hypothetical protein